MVGSGRRTYKNAPLSAAASALMVGAPQRRDMGYDTTSLDDVESVLPDDAGGLWFLKEPLDTEHVALSVLDLEPGVSGKEHSHDGQEEVYLVVEGGVEFDVGGEAVALDEGEALRVDADTTRQVHNGDERSRLVVAGAPRDAA